MAIQCKEILVFIVICHTVLEISLSHMVIANGKILRIRENYKHAGLIVLQWSKINSTQHSCVYFSPMPLLYIGTSIQRIIYDVTRIEITKVFSSNTVWMCTRFPAKFLKAKRKDAQMGTISVQTDALGKKNLIKSRLVSPTSWNTTDL